MPKIVKRELFKRAAQHIEQPEMTIILGPRQVGKTVLLGQLQNWLKKNKKIKPEAIIYYNLDIIRDWEIVRDQTKFIEFLRKISSKEKVYVFIDEAQRVENPGRFYKGIYDSNLNIKLILTGSSSLEFASQIQESLAGRKRIFYLYPFSFAEFLSSKGKKLSFLHEKELKSLFEEHMVWGGYPRVVSSTNDNEKQAVLADIYSSYIEKDIIGFLKIKNKAKFNKLIGLLAGQIGQLVNIDGLAANTEMDRDTISRYLRTLEQTYIIKVLTPYFRNPRQEIIKNPKNYFIDNGMRNYLLDDFRDIDLRPDRGLLFENSVFKELFLIKQKQLFALHFWRTKQGAEVDFIIEKARGLIPVETKFDSRSVRLSAGLKNFVVKYKPTRGYIISLGLQSRKTINNTKIDFVYPYELNKIFQYSNFVL